MKNILRQVSMDFSSDLFLLFWGLNLHDVSPVSQDPDLASKRFKWGFTPAHYAGACGQVAFFFLIMPLLIRIAPVP